MSIPTLETPASATTALANNSGRTDGPHHKPLPFVRNAVRDLLMSSPAFHELDPGTRQQLATSMVKVCQTAAGLIREEIESDVDSNPATTVAFQSPAEALATDDSDVARSAPRRSQLATAQAAGDDFSGVAADRMVDTTRRVLNAVSFPRFVTELINGVFKAMVDSNQQQMHSYVELLNNVSASLSGFADSNMGPDAARRWLVERFPGSFEIVDQSDDGWGDGARYSVELRDGAEMPSDEAVRTALGLEPNETVPSDDPDESLVPLVRRALARQKQQMLATMVMLGMQRIVIESGRINASMRFHIDTRSAAQAEEGSSFDFQHASEAKGEFGVGPWGLSASMKNTIGYVSTQKSQTTEEMNTDLNLDSAVELYFRTDYLPLTALAGKGKVDRIKVNTLNPAADLKAITDARARRLESARAGEKARRASLDTALKQKRVEAPKLANTTPERSSTSAQKPAAQKPAAQKPAAQKPAAQKPAAQKPAAQKPAAQKPAAQKPAAKTPTTAKPTAQEKGHAKSQAFANGLASESHQPRWSRLISVGFPQGSTHSPSQKFKQPDVIYLPTPPDVVDRVLEIAKVGPSDLLYDPGCGDGRIVAAAAGKFGARAVGFDVDPERIREATDNIRRHNVRDRARIVQQDLFSVDLRPASVVFLYLLPSLNLKLLPQLRQLRPGTRIVSHDFDLAGIKPEKVVKMTSAYDNHRHTIYLWTTPLKPQWRDVKWEYLRTEADASHSANKGHTVLSGADL